MKSSFIIFSHLNLKATNQEITEKWLEHRIQLLENITLASLHDQTDMNFLYVLAISDSTPRDVRRRIGKILHTWLPRNHELLLVSKEQTNYPCKNSALLVEDKGGALLKPYVEPDELGHVFTTHIGTDDALARNYVQEVRTVYDWGKYSFHGIINYHSGYICRADADSTTFIELDDNRYYFITLREPIDQFKGILWAPHSRINRIVPVVHPPAKNPMWIKTIHGDNIGNYPSWRRPRHEVVGNERVVKIFSINVNHIVAAASCN